MMNHRHFILLLLVFAACSCKTKRHSQTSWRNEDVKEQYPEAEIGPYQKGSDLVTIKSISLKRNILTLEVSYSGGCVEPHDFRLIGSQMLTKSLPPIRNVQLFHNAKGDNCKAMKTEKLQFSITRLAEHHDAGNKVKLQFENYNEMLEYTYE
ncbi:MAG: hypothetical protein K0R65_391 [Crocinitomicaceae bacterium]|jgi:hypothetical protein|nr:hypothetical protein [Crocinitomicaceae bacterium]